jgi:hypothetical protein
VIGHQGSIVFHYKSIRCISEETVLFKKHGTYDD